MKPFGRAPLCGGYLDLLDPSLVRPLRIHFESGSGQAAETAAEFPSLPLIDSSVFSACRRGPRHSSGKRDPLGGE